MKKKILVTYHEMLYQLITFRISEFTNSKKILNMDYESFMICSVVAAHFNYNNLKENKKIDWEESWNLAKLQNNEKLLKKNRITIFAVSQILNIPKESVRRKVVNLIKKKILKHTTKMGVVFGDKIDIFKPYAIKEIIALSSFLKSLKKNESLNHLLEIKEQDLN
jgi:predicted transcriptional regulator